MRERRIACGMTLEELAYESGMDEKHLSKVELGKREPSSKTICKLSVPLNLDANQLISEVIHTIDVPHNNQDT
ncbi:helix-turn-helix domain-containing protein [Lentibacillus jeotgali]|uniref:helix-turn-helix domain-containing protein n=1 Tax=Lentibacillus jeotgali TaxID=558169 RepID=UPI0002627041|nr:helix-turn-helix transcriptional regulator [Lentibacillus jeotgali]